HLQLPSRGHPSPKRHLYRDRSDWFWKDDHALFVSAQDQHHRFEAAHCGGTGRIRSGRNCAGAGDRSIGLTFARVLRSFLRQDPDRIMVGETRDLETAQIAIQASLTGHLVFTTLHTNDAPGAITRLIDMGVEPFLISST